MADWIEIAYRARRTSGPLLVWEKLSDSPYTVMEAKELYDEGLAEIAHRHEPERVVMLLKMRKQPDNNRVRLFR